MVAACQMRFSSDGPRLLFQTKRLNVYQGPGAEVTPQEVSWTQLPDIARGVYGVFCDAYKPDTVDTAHPSRDVGGFHLELGGRQELTALKLREGLKGWFASGLTTLRETATIFLKNLVSTVTGAKDKFAAMGNVANGLFQPVKPGEVPVATSA